MQDQPQEYEYAARRIYNKLFEELNGKFKGFYYGETLIIGASLLPALIVDWENADPAAAPTRTDKFQQSITIKVVIDKMQDASIKFNGTDGRIDSKVKVQLERLVMARDAITTEYMEDTVMGVLRRNFSMDGTITRQSAPVAFGITERATEGDPILTAEAHIRLKATEKIQVHDQR